MSSIEVGTGRSRTRDSFSAAREAALLAVAQTNGQPLSLTTVFFSAPHDPDEVARGVSSVVGDSPMIGASTVSLILGDVSAPGSVVVGVLASPHLTAEVRVGQGVTRDWNTAVTEALPRGNAAVYFREDPKLGRPYYFSQPSAGLSPVFALIFTPWKPNLEEGRGHEVQRFLTRRTLGRIPLVGGGACTSDLESVAYQIVNGRAYSDAVVIGVIETDLLFGIGVSHCLTPSGRRVLVGRTEGHCIWEIDGRPAAEVFAEWIGVTVRKLEEESLLLWRAPIGSTDSFGQYEIISPERVVDGAGIQFGQLVEGLEAITPMELDSGRLVKAAETAVIKAEEIGQVRDPAVTFLFYGDYGGPIGGSPLKWEEAGLRRLADRCPTVGCTALGQFAITDEGISCFRNRSVAALVLGQDLEPFAVQVRQRANVLAGVEAELVRRNAELEAVSSANSMLHDGREWRNRIPEIEAVLAELTGATHVAVRVEPTAKVSLLTSRPPIQASGSPLLLPLVSMGRAFGSIVLEGTGGLKSLDVAESIAHLIAVNAHRSLMELTVEEQARELDTVQRIAEEILRAKDYRQPLGAISGHVAAHVEASEYSLWLEDRAGNLDCEFSTGTGPSAMQAPLAEHAFKTSTLQGDKWEGDPGYRVALPLLVGDTTNGVLVLVRPRPWTSAELGFLKYLSWPLATTAESYRRQRESTAVREIHHRIKNNLQMLVSLLNLQLRRVTDPEARQVLEESRARIIGFARVHEALCERGELDRVDVVELVRTVVGPEDNRHPESGPSLSIDVVSESALEVSAQKASSLALAVGELVSNAIKYGRSPTRESHVLVLFSREDGKVVVTISDNGPGLSPGFQEHDTRGLGLRLVRAIAEEDLRGRFFLESTSAGVTARIVLDRECEGGVNAAAESNGSAGEMKGSI